MLSTPELDRFQAATDSVAGSLDELSSKALRVSDVARQAQIAVETPGRIEQDIDEIGDKLEKLKLILRTTDKVGPLKSISNVLIKTLDAVKRANDQLESAARNVRKRIEDTGVIDKLEDMQDRLNGFASDATAKGVEVREVGQSAAEFQEGLEVSFEILGDPVRPLAAATEASVRPANLVADELIDLYDNDGTDLDGNQKPITASDDIEDRLDDFVKLIERADFTPVIEVGNDVTRIKELICILEAPLDIAYAALKPIEGLLNAADAVLAVTVQPVLDFVLDKLGLEALMNSINDLILSLLPDVDPLIDLENLLPDVSADLDGFLDGVNVDLPNFGIDNWIDTEIFEDLLSPLNAPGSATQLGTFSGPNRDDLIIGDDLDGGTPRDLADLIDPGDGNDTVQALEGDDIIIASEGDDTIFGGNGEDRVILAGSFFEYVFEGRDDNNDGENDYVVATHARPGAGELNVGTEELRDVEFVDFTVALPGFESIAVADLLNSQTAQAGETLEGEDDQNDYLFALGAATLRGLGGNDFLGGSSGVDRLEGGLGNDTIASGEGADFVDGGGGRDAWVLEPNRSAGNIQIDLSDNEIFLGVQDDSIFNVEDILIFAGQPVFQFRGDDQDNALNIPDLVGNKEDNVNGAGGDDVLETGDGDDILIGGDGDDTLRGGARNDTLLGGADPTDNDRYEGGADSDTLNYTVRVTQNILGVDTGRFANVQAIYERDSSGNPNQSVDFGARTAIVVDHAAGTVDRLDASGNTVGRDTFDGIETIVGGNGNDTLFGLPSTDLDGVTYTIDGGEGDDMLFTRGTDRAIGGDGDDEFILEINQDEPTRTRIEGGDNDSRLEGLAPLSQAAGDRIGLDAPDVRWSISNNRVEGFSTLDNQGLGSEDDAAQDSRASRVFSGRFVEIETIFLGDENDEYYTDNQVNFFGVFVDGGGGDDVLQGISPISSGTDRYYFNGGEGDDRIFVTEEASIDGGPGDDVIRATRNGDIVAYGGDGDDVVEVQLQTLFASPDLRGGDASGDDPDATDTIIIDTGSTSSSRPGVEIRPDPGNGASALTYREIGSGFQEGRLQGFERIVGSSNPNASDNIQTRALDEELFGQAGNDFLFAAGGNDVIYGGLGIDTMRGGQGDDLLHSDDVDDILDGGEGIDTASFASSFPDYPGQPFFSAVEDALQSQIVTAASLTGKWIDLRDGLVEFVGGQNPAVLLGAPARTAPRELIGIDNVYGTEADDVIRGNNVDNVLSGAGGDDYIVGGFGDDTIIPGAGDDTVEGGAGVDTIVVSEGRLTIIGDGTDILDFGALEGEVTYDYANLNYVAALPVSEAVWRDTGTTETRQFDAGSGMSNFTPRSILEADASFSDSPDDLSRALPERPANEDEAALDTWRRSQIATTVMTPSFEGTASGIASVIGGAGITRLIPSLGIDLFDGTATPLDTLVLSGLASAVNFELGTGVTTNAELAGDGWRGIDVIEASSRADRVVGDAGDQTIHGFAGADTLGGNAGDDWLEGGGAADQLFGGNGADTAGYTGSNAPVVVSLLAGTAAGGHATGDRLFAIENLSGSRFGDFLTGDMGDNTLSGADGDDTLVGLEGADMLDGGEGIDTADYTAAAIGVSIELFSGVTAGGASGDELADIENIEGSRERDMLAGDKNANTLRGGNKNDTLKGGGDDDALGGGAGNDWLQGGAGGDGLFGGDGFDTADYASSKAGVTIALFNGTASRGDAAGDTFVSIESLSGSNLADVLQGDGGRNTLNGRDGRDFLNGGREIDRLFGGIGNDTLEGGDGGDTIDGEGGNDTAQYLSSNAGVHVALFSGTATGGHAAGDIISDIENIIGSQLDDTIEGDSKGNVLQGRSGSDVINGGRGNDALGGENDDDILEGGAGADRLFGGNGSDTAQYLSSTAGVTVALFDGTASGGHANGDQFFSIENVTGSNLGDDLSGDTEANTIRGADGNDTIKGGRGDDALGGEGGADVIVAGPGDDRVFGGGGPDRFHFLEGSDRDRVFDFVDDVDTLGIDRALVGNRNEQRTVDDFASVVNGHTVFDFGGGDILEVRGITNPDALVNDIDFL